MHFQLAWRNIWRNPRRTAVILLAVIIGVWSMIFLGALMRGIMTGMIDNGIATLTGHIKIYATGYRDDPVIENSITDPQSIFSVLQELLPPGSRWTSRVRVNAVANNARHASGVMIVGIEPGQEIGLSFIGKAVTDGRYLDQTDANGIIVGRALLEKFETRIGHKLVLMSQDTQRDIASKAFRIIGTFTSEMESTEKQFVFVTQTAAQQFLKMGNAISEVSIVLPVEADEAQVSDSLKKALSGKGFDVLTWQELLPILTIYLKLYDGFIFVWFVVIFIAMGFGIVNTTLMAVFERIREFGLLKAMGMKPGHIVKQILLESALMLIVGVLSGNVLAYSSIAGLSQNGIDLTALAAGAEFAGMSRVIFPVLYGQDVVLANLVVFVLGVLVCLYPAVKAARITAVEALGHT